MAILAAVTSRQFNVGTFTSPAAAFPTRLQAGRYRLNVTWAAPERNNTALSWKVEIQWFDGVAWRGGGGISQRGGTDAGATPGEYYIRSWRTENGAIMDDMQGRQVRVQVTVPAPEFPGTTGPVNLGASVEDA